MQKLLVVENCYFKTRFPLQFHRLASLIEAIRQQNDGGLLPGSASGPTSMMQSGINQAKEVDDPQGLHEKTEYLLREWVQMYHNPNIGRDINKAFSTFVTQVCAYVDSCLCLLLTILLLNIDFEFNYA